MILFENKYRIYITFIYKYKLTTSLKMSDSEEEYSSDNSVDSEIENNDRDKKKKFTKDDLPILNGRIDSESEDESDNNGSEEDEEEDDSDFGSEIGDLDDAWEKGTGKPKTKGKNKQVDDDYAGEETDYLQGLQGDYEGDDEDYDDDDDDATGENYLQKFSESIKQTVIQDYHQELIQHNYHEIEALVEIQHPADGSVDPLHRTLPFMTKYEKARILGERAKQINCGAMPFVKVKENVIDGYLIALQELEERKIPFIIKRPLQNGGFEYWRVRDLEIL